MKRTLALGLLGGREAAAKWLGCTAHSISNWTVDSDDHLTSPRVRDSIVAALVRKHACERLARGDAIDPREAELLDIIDPPSFSTSEG